MTPSNIKSQTAEEYLKDRFWELLVLKVSVTKEQVEFIIKKALSLKEQEGIKIGEQSALKQSD